MERVRGLAPIVKKAVHKAISLCPIGPVILMGPSMRPTFNQNDSINIVLAERISVLRGKVGRGDVVTIHSPEKPWKLLTKRIKAVGGDIVSYAPDYKNADLKKTLVVPNGHIWVEGDNWRNSRDSRYFGAVPYTHLRSRVFAVVWPPRDCKLIRNNDFQKHRCCVQISGESRTDSRFWSSLQN